MKTVAVIVPCWNYAKYLPECIDSLVNQTYKINEIIIVNDGSPDNTTEVANQLIAKYPRSNISLIEKKNGGLSSARNAGIRASKSQLISCVDADDKMTPGGIEEMVNLMDDDMVLAQTALMEFGERHVIMTPTKDSGLERIMQSNTVFCNAMFSKKVWEAVGGFDEAEVMRFGYEDWEFWIRVLAYGCRLRTSDMIALRYRAHSNNMTKEHSFPNRHKLYKYIFEKHRDLYEEKNLLVAGMLKENQ
jgi:glycosyltransferase involved in cell wall biosynthesis